LNQSHNAHIPQDRLKQLGFVCLKRLMTSLVVLFLATFIILLIVMLAPGSASDVLGFKSEGHEPRILSTLKWLFNVVFKFDFGQSLIYEGKSVSELLKPRFARTAILTLFSLLITLVIGVTVGGIAATGRYPRISAVASALSYLASAAPVYWVAFGAIYLFSQKLGWFPIRGGAQNYPSWVYFILPICLLGIFNGVLGEVIRHIRSELEDILKMDYMQAVRARGLGRRTYWWHAFRNAFVPAIRLLTSNLTLLLGGAVVLEYVFTLRGIGYQAWESASKRDFPVMLGITVILVFCVVVLRLISDLLCYLIDPRFQDENES
jgi:peptide/nickel transport system permease protein